MPQHRSRSCRSCFRGTSWIFLVLLLACFAVGFVPSRKPQQHPRAALAISAASADHPSMAESSSTKAQESSTLPATASERSAAAPNTTGGMRFGRFVIPEASIFGRNGLSAAFVNLRPIVPGHVLVTPVRIVPHLEDLNEDEYQSLWSLVRTVQSALRRAHPGTTAFNVAVQDGRAAGQSIPHVHVHVLPRSGGDDFERNDDVYDALDAWAPTRAESRSKPRSDLEVPEDADRVDRTAQQMADEAATYRELLEELGR